MKKHAEHKSSPASARQADRSSNKKLSKSAKTRIIVYTIAGIVVCGLIAALLCVNYLGKQRDKIIREVTIELQDQIRLEDFFTEMLPEARFYTDISQINTSIPATYQLTVEATELHFFDIRQQVVLNVVDIVPPAGEAVPQDIYTYNLPDVNDVVTNVYDLTPVTIAYVGEPDVTRSGSYEIPVSLTDTSGNETIINVPFEITDDHIAPLIRGAHDFEAFIGDPIQYLNGITVTDNIDPNPELYVDTSRVNTHISSTFPVTYVATDENGNTSSVTVNMRLRVKPERYYEPEEVYDLCRQAIEIYHIFDEDMTDVEKAFRIVDWCYNHLSFIGTSDKSHWTTAVYDGLTTLQGDCFTYWAIVKAMLDVCGIPNYQVTRNPITWSPHYWNLVYLEGQWYHCDSCYAYYHEGYFFMYSDSDLPPGSHTYDPADLPAGIVPATESVQYRVNYTTLEVAQA